LEKESLRVSPDGSIAQTPHPRALGSALTHPFITTDYSEALLEFITPPLPALDQALAFLRDTHQFVYHHLGEEYLWATSMPCVVAGEQSIPIAQYGESNAGMMKTVYRRGLGHRYGRMMQVIAGVHFNYSVPAEFWPIYRELEQSTAPLQSFISQSYFQMIRNLLRLGWLIPYLFGASPAICKTFLEGQPTRLDAFDPYTYYEPFATSLRMGDIGYQNSQEVSTGIRANYDSLDAYVASLTRAIGTPCPDYQKIGVVINGAWEQLNANILQIENEYYSTVRPKQLVEGMEKPTLALKRRGVRYVELRSLDVNAFDPLGISEEQLLFLEAFMLFCLLSDSPPIAGQERRAIDSNQELTAHYGRDPQLKLQRNGRSILLREWAEQTLDVMSGIFELLERASGHSGYRASLAEQRARVRDPERTPSARMLEEMRTTGESFHQFAKRMSLKHGRYFNSLPVPEAHYQMLDREARRSLATQQEMEAAEQPDFGQFLERYFSQQ
jgi:glutamate--cysteine ligase